MASTLVFDLGGVVLHWQPAELLRQCLAERVSSEAAAMALAATVFESCRPGAAWTEFDRGHLSGDAIAQHIADGRAGLSRAQVDRLMLAIPAHMQLRSDCTALLARLHAAGHRMLFLSNMPAPYVAHVRRHIDDLGMFEDGVYSSDVGLVKPEPAFFEFAQRRFGCAAADLVFFDDSEVNVDAALSLGWQARRFVDVETARRDLIELGLLPADATVETTP